MADSIPNFVPTQFQEQIFPQQRVQSVTKKTLLEYNYINIRTFSGPIVLYRKKLKGATNLFLSRQKYENSAPSLSSRYNFELAYLEF